MKYYRVHTADVAWITKQPRGIFTAISKLVDAKTMNEEEIATYWKNRAYSSRQVVHNRLMYFVVKQIKIPHRS